MDTLGRVQIDPLISRYNDKVTFYDRSNWYFRLHWIQIFCSPICCQENKKREQVGMIIIINEKF